MGVSALRWRNGEIKEEGEEGIRDMMRCWAVYSRDAYSARGERKRRR